MRVVAVVALALCGCQDSRFFHSARSFIGQPVGVPETKQASIQAAARVDQVGRQILSANIFCGVDVAFQTLGSTETLLFHRGQQSVFISDSLVNRCQTDEELAAVLCHELGLMVAEKRNATRMGYSNPDIEITLTNSGEAQALADRLRPVEPAATRHGGDNTTDPRRIAIEMLKTTGIDEKNYPKGEQLLRGLNKNRDIVKQLDGGAAKVEWSN